MLTCAGIILWVVTLGVRQPGPMLARFVCDFVGASDQLERFLPESLDFFLIVVVFQFPRLFCPLFHSREETIIRPRLCQTVAKL